MNIKKNLYNVVYPPQIFFNHSSNHAKVEITVVIWIKTEKGTFRVSRNSH